MTDVTAITRCGLVKFRERCESLYGRRLHVWLKWLFIGVMYSQQYRTEVMLGG